MEIFKLSIPATSQVPYRIPIFTPKPCIQFPSNNSYKFRKSHFKPYLHRTHLPLPCCRHFHISAQFRRRSPQRNSLRKKLAVQVPTLENDDPHTQSNLATSGSVIVNQIDSEFGAVESVLWNKLEGWIEQYKKDVEFWGLGSGPIFTVYRDLNGNVKRVLVDEDEIPRRNQIMPSEFGEDGELEEFGEMSSKISHARFVAKEMEIGNNNVLPNSSLVVKFVVYKDSSSSRLVSGIRNGLMRFDCVPNVSMFGIVPLFGLLVVWVVNKYFSKREGEKELTRLEKEMLRRKTKSSQKKETLKDDNIEVIPEFASY